MACGATAYWIPAFAGMTMSAFNLGEVGDCQRRGAKIWVGRVDRDMVEELIDRRAELSHLGHGRRKVLARNSRRGSLLDLVNGFGERLFLRSFEQAWIGWFVVLARIPLLLDA